VLVSKEINVIRILEKVNDIDRLKIIMNAFCLFRIKFLMVDLKVTSNISSICFRRCEGSLIEAISLHIVSDCSTQPNCRRQVLMTFIIYSFLIASTGLAVADLKD